MLLPDELRLWRIAAKVLASLVIGCGTLLSSWGREKVVRLLNAFKAEDGSFP